MPKCARAKYSRLGRLPVYCRERVPLKIINTNPNTYPNPPNIITLSADSNNTSKARNKYS